LKNHALLLFGPSSFEHWFKSCKSFSVRSLLFSIFANQSSAAFLPLSSSWRLCSPALFLSSLPPAQYLDSGHRQPPPVPPLPRVAVPSSHRSSPLVLVFRLSATSPTGCQHRMPELLPPPQFLRKLALSLPLVGSIAPVASPRFICPESLLAQLVPSSFHLRRPTHFSGELRVTVGRHIQATTARTEPSGSFPSTHRCFPAPSRPSIPAEKLPRSAPPATAFCPPWAGHLSHLRALRTLQPARPCSSEAP
jgi:hypothetical protein